MKEHSKAVIRDVKKLEWVITKDNQSYDKLVNAILIHDV